jgi:hypothetical protein
MHFLEWDSRYFEEGEVRKVWRYQTDIHRMIDNTVVKIKRTNNDLQNTTQKTNVWATRTPLNLGLISGAPDRLAVHAPLLTYVMVNVDYYRKTKMNKTCFSTGLWEVIQIFYKNLPHFCPQNTAIRLTGICSIIFISIQFKICYCLNSKQRNLIKAMPI